MAIKIEKTLIAKYKGGKNYSTGRAQKVKYVVEHHTATMASAWDNLKYFASKWVGASAHYFIDRDGKIYQSVLEKDTAYSVGAKSYKHASARNSNSINIEYISDGRAFTEEQIKAGAALTQDIIKRYGLKSSDILRHFDVTGKKCPSHYVNTGRWQALLARLKLIVAKPAPKPPVLVAPKPAPKPAPVAVKPAPKPVAKPKPAYVLSRALYKGCKGADVKALQLALNKLGHKLTADGDFGAKTAKAVALFQGSKRLKPDSIVGKATAQALGWKWKS